MYKVSNHLTYKEVTHSQIAKKLGISNEPTAEQLERIIDLVNNVFEPLREHFDVPIFASSIFRSKELNKELKGADNSQHCANNGAAMDLDADVLGIITNGDIFYYILNNLEYDQLIAEAVDKGRIEWVHVSYNKGKNRKQALLMYKNKMGKTVYEKYSKERLEQFLNNE